MLPLINSGILLTQIKRQQNDFAGQSTPTKVINTINQSIPVKLFFAFKFNNKYNLQEPE